MLGDGVSTWGAVTLPVTIRRRLTEKQRIALACRAEVGAISQASPITAIKVDRLEITKVWDLISSIRRRNSYRPAAEKVAGLGILANGTQRFAIAQPNVRIEWAALLARSTLLRTITAI